MKAALGGVLSAFGAGYFFTVWEDSNTAGFNIPGAKASCAVLQVNELTKTTSLGPEPS